MFLTYVRNRIDHPSLCCKCIQMTHYKSRADIRAMVCIARIDRHRSLNCSDILRVAYNSPEVDRILCDRSGHRTSRLAILGEARKV